MLLNSNKFVQYYMVFCVKTCRDCRNDPIHNTIIYVWCIKLLQQQNGLNSGKKTPAKDIIFVFSSEVAWLDVDEVSSTLFVGEVIAAVGMMKRGGNRCMWFRVRVYRPRKLIHCKNVIPGFSLIRFENQNTY